MPRSNGIVRAGTFLFDFCQFLANGLANLVILEEGFHYRRFADYDGCIDITEFIEADQLFYT